jgi:diguanylate cyclase (GGDEF)-like protein
MSDPADFVNGRILVIDDNPAIHQDFEKILSRGPEADAGLSQAEKILFGDTAAPSKQPSFELHFAQQGSHGVSMVARALAENRPFALAFIDMRMPPGWDGLETIEHLWAADPDVQVVICSAHSDYDWSDFMERLGHSDKLLVLKKPFEPIEVLQCASALTRKWQDAQVVRQQVQSLEHVVAVRTSGLEAANRQLRHLATHDALTGLPNRVLLDDRLGQTLVHAERSAGHFAVMVLDLDRFKFINDSLGHRAGDELLNRVATRLRGVVNDFDTVARIGGDEFVLVITSAPRQPDAVQLAQSAIDALKAPLRIAGVDLHISTSIGIACYPEHGTTPEALVAHADAAMYCAKERGRNNLQCFEPGMDTPTRERMKLEADLHGALGLKQFELYYQPKVDTATDYFHSAEALIRWRHPERGIVMPEEFITLAEDCGLIGSIGDWVLNEACRQCKAWQKDGYPPLRVAVNVTATQFRQGNLFSVIQKALDEHQLDPRFLELELTESAVMTNPEESAGILERLSTMGVLVSVDDFGTGYSSMSYLRRFPIDKLKIDRGFVKDLMTRADDASIVQAIISLAHSLRLKVVAEGVETVEQLDSLKSMGCDQYQGFHFSPPLPAADFSDLLRRRQNDENAFAEEAARTHSKLAPFKG